MPRMGVAHKDFSDGRLPKGAFLLVHGLVFVWMRIGLLIRLRCDTTEYYIPTKGTLAEKDSSLEACISPVVVSGVFVSSQTPLPRLVSRVSAPSTHAAPSQYKLEGVSIDGVLKVQPVYTVCCLCCA